MLFGAFGTPAAAPAAPNLFASAAPVSDSAPSSRSVKWAVSTLNDAGVHVSSPDASKYLAISLIDSLRPFSFEELRLADYSQGDKGGENPPAHIAQQHPQTSLFGAAAQPQTQPSLFGATPQQQTAPSLFGAAPQQQSQPSLFGAGAQQQSQPSLFGAGAQQQSQSSLFGGAQQSQPSLFGGGAQQQSQPSLFGGAQPQSQPSLFGGAAQPQSTPSLFGGAAQPQSAPSLFSGGAQPQSTPSLFGGAQQQSQPSLFGGTQQQSQPSLFGGAPQQSQPSLFGGQQSQPSLFGGAQQQSQPSLFGGAGQQSQPSLFGGQQSQPSLFGAQQSQPSLFGGQQSQPSLFGAPQSQPSLFGAPQSQPSLFGAPQSQPSLFGAQQSQPSLFGGAVANAPPALLPPPTPQVSLTSNPFGVSQLITGASTAGVLSGPDASKPAPESKRVVVAAPVARPYRHAGWYKASPMRPWGREGSLFNTGGAVRALLPSSGASTSGFPAPWRNEQQVAKAANIKKIVVEPAHTYGMPVVHLLRSRHRPTGPPLSDRLSQRAALQQSDALQDDGNDDTLDDVQPRNIIERRSLRVEKEREREKEGEHAARENNGADGEQENAGTDVANDNMSGSGRNEDDTLSNNTNDGNDTTTIGDDELTAAGDDVGIDIDGDENAAPGGGGSTNGSHNLVPAEAGMEKNKPRDARIVSYSEVYRNALTSASSRRRVSLGDRATAVPARDAGSDGDGGAETKAVYPTSTRADAYVRPELAELQSLSEEALCAVDGLVYGVRGVGEVQWLQPVDVRGVDLDKAVKIVPREVSVYPTERGLAVPPPGEGLNVRAVVRLHGIWKHDKRTKQPLRDASSTANIVARLKRHCDSEGLTFLGYEVRTGTWTFRTEHF